MTTQMAPNLQKIAALNHIAITEHHGGEKGRWYSDIRTISLRHDLHPTTYRCTLAHELGHALYGHDSKAEGWLKERQEHEADTWAANSLISQKEYKDAELTHEAHSGAIALELGVTVHLVEVWRDSHKTILPAPSQTV